MARLTRQRHRKEPHRGEKPADWNMWGSQVSESHLYFYTRIGKENSAWPENTFSFAQAQPLRRVRARPPLSPTSGHFRETRLVHKRQTHSSESHFILNSWAGYKSRRDEGGRSPESTAGWDSVAAREESSGLQVGNTHRGRSLDRTTEAMGSH